jgi:hypothetical protein
MRTKGDPHHRIMWPDWTMKSRTEIVAMDADSDLSGSCIDVKVEGPWLNRWSN